jgi:hypothetical protein
MLSVSAEKRGSVQEAAQRDSGIEVMIRLASLLDGIILTVELFLH